MPKEKTKDVTLESDVKCCGFIWYVGFFCLNEVRDVSDDTVALFPLFGNLNHRVLSSQASSALNVHRVPVRLFHKFCRILQFLGSFAGL